MYLIDQDKKAIMENCKKIAREHGLSFTDESLEYIVTNRDINELKPKTMIPTLYDYWVHDVDIIKGHRIYDIFPHNPFETVINTRPPISFYNDNNPQWLDTMIYYHVLGHIDFFQNNQHFERTWNDDFLGKALSDKRRINEIREKLGSEKRWVDYVIEFSRGVDNLVGFHKELRTSDLEKIQGKSNKLKFYFGKFLREKKDLKISEFYEDVEKHRKYVSDYGDEKGDEYFLNDIKQKYPEFENTYKRECKEEPAKESSDILEFILNNAEYLNQEKYKWIKEVIRVVRETSLYFYPQILTKIMNEGWASYWHQDLFEKDPMVDKNIIDYARVNSYVMNVPKKGMNPYAIGNLLFDHIYNLAQSGKLNYEFEKITDINERSEYNNYDDLGLEAIFRIRKYFDDYTLINFLDKKNFQDFVDQNKLFVTEKILNLETLNWEHYIKSRDGEDYREMLKENTYHPPYIRILNNKLAPERTLYLKHEFEGKPLISKYIPNVLIGLEFLWNGPVVLDTVEYEFQNNESVIKYLTGSASLEQCTVKKSVRYSVENKKLSKSFQGIV